MDSTQYSPEQRKDIENRVDKAKKMLEELDLQPAVLMHAVNLKEDVFGMRPIPYLQDMKYKNVVSPLQKT